MSRRRRKRPYYASVIRVAPVRRTYPLLAAALVVLLLGAGVAWGVDGALGLSHRPADRKSVV